MYSYMTWTLTLYVTSLCCLLNLNLTCLCCLTLKDTYKCLCVSAITHIKPYLAIWSLRNCWIWLAVCYIRVFCVISFTTIYSMTQFNTFDTYFVFCSLTMLIWNSSPVSPRQWRSLSRSQHPSMPWLTPSHCSRELTHNNQTAPSKHQWPLPLNSIKISYCNAVCHY